MEMFDTKRTLEITEKSLQSLGTSLNRESTVLVSNPLLLQKILIFALFSSIRIVLDLFSILRNSDFASAVCRNRDSKVLF